jgi:hypothetical protein
MDKIQVNRTNPLGEINYLIKMIELGKNFNAN